MKTAFRTSLLAMALFAGVTLAHADAIDDITAAGQVNARRVCRLPALLLGQCRHEP